MTETTRQGDPFLCRTYHRSQPPRNSIWHCCLKLRSLRLVVPEPEFGAAGPVPLLRPCVPGTTHGVAAATGDGNAAVSNFWQYLSTV